LFSKIMMCKNKKICRPKKGKLFGIRKTKAIIANYKQKRDFSSQR